MRRLRHRIHLVLFLVVFVVGSSIWAILSSPHKGVRALGFLGLFLIFSTLTRPLARMLSRPVERLTEASRQLGAGNLSYRVPLPPWYAYRRARPRFRRRPIDEVMELTRAWNEMAERVERLVRGQKELLANVSHELRSPLARIRVALELLPRDGATDARLRDIEADLGELDRLIEDVLTSSRLDATGLPTHLGPVDAGELLGSLAERARLAGHEVRVEAPAALTLTADGALLRRALWNLVENAAKYGAPPITLSAEARGERVVLAVADEGKGIDPGERERVLEPFYRGDPARTPSRGFGLGLTLARRIAEVHGGRLSFAPRERGLKVELDLPREPPAAA